MTNRHRLPPRDPDAEEQASLWAARLDESPSLAPNDRAALDAWLAADPSHRDLLAGYCQLSADLEEQLPALVAAGCVAPSEPVRSREAPIRRLRTLWWSSAAACATLAAVVCALWLLPGEGDRRIADFSTPPAQRRSLALPDGSRVELNASTSLSYEHRRDERHLRLEKGQAYFVVAKDSTRPFVVDTPSGSVRVTGTIFDVRMGSEGTLEVTVVEGSVQVKPLPPAERDGASSPASAAASAASAGRHGSPSGTGAAAIDTAAGDGAATTTASASPQANPPHAALITLGANDRLTCDRLGIRLQALDAAAREDLLGWRQGRIVFDGTPLGEALARFSAYHARPIVATPPAAALRLSGRFSLDDFDGFISGVQQFLPVSAVRDAAGTLHITLNPVR